MIKDKVVIITGASSGIGASTAKLLAGKGAKVVLGARREEKLKQLVDEIQSAGGEAVYQVMDVVDPADNEAVVELAKEEFGGVDVIFLNAGKKQMNGIKWLMSISKAYSMVSPPCCQRLSAKSPGMLSQIHRLPG
jgi:NADP-dependent 3-hydroxy acid dehydrogenase YdfG